jgi:hypothetical protein
MGGLINSSTCRNSLNNQTSGEGAGGVNIRPAARTESLGKAVVLKMREDFRQVTAEALPAREPGATIVDGG